MARGFAADASSWKDYPGKMTLFVFLSCLLAATGGLSFGYNIGISGGMKSMESFLNTSFPSAKTLEDKNKIMDYKEYCRFESRELTAFISSVYLAALVASLFAATVTRVFGRKWSMLVGGTSFLVGSAINGAAVNLAMLIIGRILLGIGVGFINQSALLYLSEMAPARLRGMLNIGFQLMVTIGILAANLINYGTDKIHKGRGWRVSLALGVVPAAIMTVGSYFLPDTPNSLIHRGQPEQAHAMLCRIRGTPDVEEEYSDLVAACEASKLVKYPWGHILKRKYRPQLTMAIFIPLFQQLTGINVIMFYATDLFRTVGLEKQASLMSAVITGLVNVFATFICIFSVDRAGRRLLFLTGGCPMVISLIVVGTFQWHVHKAEKHTAGIMVAFLCIYVVGFAWSWGPLGWLVPSEIFPLEIRSQGQSLSLSVNMLFTFLIAQAFLSMLCHMKFVLFYYFAGWVSVMTAFVYLFLPETKGVPIEQMTVVWKRHWFWKRFVQYEEVKAGLIGNTGRSTDAT